MIEGQVDTSVSRNSHVDCVVVIPWLGLCSTFGIDCVTVDKLEPSVECAPAACQVIQIATTKYDALLVAGISVPSGILKVPMSQ